MADKKAYYIERQDSIQIYRTEKDDICLEQENPFEDNDCIVVSVDRVDQLIAFLQAIKDDILTERADRDRRDQLRSVTVPERSNRES